jgi:hypothetical protein
MDNLSFRRFIEEEEKEIKSSLPDAARVNLGITLVATSASAVLGASAKNEINIDFSLVKLLTRLALNW